MSTTTAETKERVKSIVKKTGPVVESIWIGGLIACSIGLYSIWTLVLSETVGQALTAAPYSTQVVIGSVLNFPVTFGLVVWTFWILPFEDGVGSRDHILRIAGLTTILVQLGTAILGPLGWVPA